MPSSEENIAGACLDFMQKSGYVHSMCALFQLEARGRGGKVIGKN